VSTDRTARELPGMVSMMAVSGIAVWGGIIALIVWSVS
jgi:hypothetical protein